MRDLCFPAAEEECYMARAALAAAERAEKEQQQNSPLQNAAPAGAQNVLASAERTLPRAQREGYRVDSGHLCRYIAPR